MHAGRKEAQNSKSKAAMKPRPCSDLETHALYRQPAYLLPQDKWAVEEMRSPPGWMEK